MKNGNGIEFRITGKGYDPREVDEAFDEMRKEISALKELNQTLYNLVKQYGDTIGKYDEKLRALDINQNRIVAKAKDGYYEATGGYKETGNHYEAVGGYKEIDDRYVATGGYEETENRYEAVGDYEEAGNRYEAEAAGGYEETGSGYVEAGDGYKDSGAGYNTAASPTDHRSRTTDHVQSQTTLPPKDSGARLTREAVERYFGDLEKLIGKEL